jgi:hypothetical protein
MSNYTSHKKKGLLSMFALVTVATLAVPYTALGAGRAVGNSGAVVGVSRPSGQQTFSRGFRHSRFFGGEGFGGMDVTAEQYQPAPTVAPDKPANKRYVQPRWVDGGYGVQVLEPGYWIDTESRR